MIRKKAAIVLGIALTLSGVLSGCENNGKAAVEALEKGDYKEAEAQFKEMTEQKDKEKAAEGYRGLGITYYSQEQYEQAMEMFSAAVENGVKETPQLYNLMGSCAMRLEDYEKALEYYKAGIALNDTSSDEEKTDKNVQKSDEEMIREMKFNEVVCYERLAQWEQAKEKVKEYLSEYPDDEKMMKESQFLETR